MPSTAHAAACTGGGLVGFQGLAGVRQPLKGVGVTWVQFLCKE
jgi:hypothetical protein